MREDHRAPRPTASRAGTQGTQQTRGRKKMKRKKARERRKKKGGGGRRRRTTRRQGPRHPGPENTERGRQHGRKGKKNRKQKRGWRAGGQQDAKAQGTPGRKTRNARDNGGKTRGKKGKHPTTTTNRATQARRGPNKQGAHQDRPQEKVRRTKTRPGGRPGPPGQEEHARTHARDPGVASSDQKGELSAST